MTTMTASEFQGWQHHFGRYPPAEYILAMIWLTLSRAFGNDLAQAEHMGYWLETPDMVKRRQSDDANSRQIAMAEMVSMVYIGDSSNG